MKYVLTVLAMCLCLPLVGENKEKPLPKDFKSLKALAEDDHESVMWFREAAGQGDAYAQYFLGEMYADGEGVPKDDVTAHAWWSIAANGFAQVTRIKDLLAQTMTPDQIAKAEALAKEMIKKNSKLIRKKK
jgi:hypothetical protein